MSRDLLLEIGCEDLPARYVQALAQALSSGICEGLDARAISYEQAHSFATPRRIAVWVRGVAEQQADQNIERRGPAVAAAYKDGAPTRAAQLSLIHI